MGISMANVDKKKLSNEKRLQAIRERQKAQKLQTQLQPKKNFGLELKSVKQNKIQLFDSDEEIVDDNAFRVRPQFEGPKGQQLFERNTELSDRFTLDERFAEEEIPDEGENKNLDEGGEKTKNLQILESLLGYEVSDKHADDKKKRKLSLPRFDPESESSAKYLKVQPENEEKKTSKKSCKKKKEDEEKVEEEIPVSSERYIEVSKDLKDILGSTSSSFSFASKFQSEVEDEPQGFNFSFASSSTAQDSSVNKQTSVDKANDFEPPNSSTHKDYNDDNFKSEYEDKNKYTFFILESDDRLKEGVEFFKRPGPIDEIREEWNRNKEYVLDLFKSKRKSNIRRHNLKHKTTQRKKVFVKE